MRKKVIDRKPMPNTNAFYVIYEDGTVGIDMPPIPGSGASEPQGPYEGYMDEPINEKEKEDIMQEYMYEMRRKDPESVLRESEMPDEPLPRKK